MIEDKYKQLCETPSDINLHLPTIRSCVTEGDYVVELGVRECVSTWALMANKPAVLGSVDIISPPQANLDEVQRAAKEEGIDFKFLLASSLTIELKDVDVLFIDTIHTYSQLIKELWLHESRVRKYIILHDTEIPEMKSCLTDFLYSPNWKVKEQLIEHCGLTVLERK